MEKLNERAVSKSLEDYFRNFCHLEPLGKKATWLASDGSNERVFMTDLAIEPTACTGNRSLTKAGKDQKMFNDLGKNSLDIFIEELRPHSLFPGKDNGNTPWGLTANPNPVFGVAIEIENRMDKYLLGSLLAASMAGRWGLLILPDGPKVEAWRKALHRMKYKGNMGPIPSNVLVFSWPTLKEHIESEDLQ